MFFRKLTIEEEATFRRWARDNYRPGDPINGAWHPILQREATDINHEHAVFVADREEAES